MFQIKLFGFFRMVRGTQVLDEGSIHSNMMMKLLVYLILFRERTVTNTELEKYLWKTNEIDNPSDALKNLMCRLRNVLKKTFDEKDFILTGRGNYRWNPKHKVELDTELFQQAYDKYKVEGADGVRCITHLENAIRVYDGMFLAHMEEDYWVNNYNMLFHSMYLYMVNQLYELYWKEHNYKAIELLCSKALAVDEFDENLNLYKVRALMKQNKYRLAEKHYHMIEQNVRSSLGVKGATLLRSIKKEMSGITKTGLISIQDLQREMNENLLTAAGSSFLCDYDEFKNLYVLQAKRNQRRGEEGYVILITIIVNNHAILNASDVEDYLVQYAMDGMRNVLVKNLREFDIAAKCSESQYVVMLDRCTYQNSLKVANRIMKQYENVASTRFIDMKIDMQKVSCSCLLRTKE